MRMDTPYRSRPKTERDRELKCMETIFRAVTESPEFVAEAFGGIGMTAALMSRLWPEATIRSWDIDAKCVAQYQALDLPNASIALDSCIDGLKELERADLVSLDFNQFTLKTMDTRFTKEVLQEALDLGPSYLQITDSAVKYLHLNAPKYGVRNLREYLTGIADRLGLYIVSAAHHSSASYLLLSPKEQPPFDLISVKS